ncbi:MAG: hypothetical protein RLZZ367_418 [Bacteroidota bacterium]|jgi:cation transport ATPase
MNALKKITGVVVMLLGVLLVIGMPLYAFTELDTQGKGTQENYLFWIIVLLIFIPCALGFTLFGWFAAKGEYTETV